MSFGLGFGFPRGRTPTSMVPSLNLNFVGATALPANFTFTRSGNATQFDSQGRLVWAPSNQIPRTDLSAGNWTKLDSTATLTSDSYDGAPAWEIQEGSAGTAYLTLNGTVAIVAGAPYTYSMYLKYGALNSWVRIVVADGTLTANGANLWVNLATKQLGSLTSRGAGTAVSSSLEDVGNGWIRVSLTLFMGSAVVLAPTILSATGDLAGGRVANSLWLASSPQVERTGVDSPKAFNPTAGASYWGPRFDYNPATLSSIGLLIEEARTNSIRNNTMQGAVAGTPGTAPTNWTISAVGGLTNSVVGTGVESGINYIDIRYAGTTSGAIFAGIGFEGIGNVAALPASIWTTSAYVRLVGGSLSNITAVKLVITNYDAGSASLNQFAITNLSVQSTGLALNRSAASSTAATFTDVNTAFVRPYIQIEANSGVAVDVTLRIGLPQLELGAFQTSVIPTYTVTQIRNAESCTAATAGWYNQLAGTFVMSATMANNDASFSRILFLLKDAGGTNKYDARKTTAQQAQFVSTLAGAASGINTANAYTILTPEKMAAAYDGAGKSVRLKGGAVVTNAVAGPSSGITSFWLGSNETGGLQFNGWTQSFVYYPTRLSDAKLQELTA